MSKQLKTQFFQKLEAATKEKRRYVEGVITGPFPDVVNDQVSKACIESISKQIGSKDVKLYADIHGIKATQDIGVIVDHRILPSGELWASFRLYDAADEMPQTTLDVIEKLWKQINGIEPYKHKEVKGFSIEGMGNAKPNGRKRPDGNPAMMIEEIDLAGVVIAPGPAYKNATATPVAKTILSRALESAKESHVMIGGNQTPRDKYWSEKWALSDLVDQSVGKIMSDPQISLNRKRDALKSLFADVADAHVQIVLRNPEAWPTGVDVAEYVQPDPVEKTTKSQPAQKIKGIDTKKQPITKRDLTKNNHASARYLLSEIKKSWKN